MCLITGFINFNKPIEKTLKVMKKLEYRGTDASGIYTASKIYTANNLKELESQLNTKSDAQIVLGHNLHSTTSHTPQPIKSETSILIANCEIYNWEAIAKKHKITAKNDSELLLKLLNKNKEIKKTLQELEGPYAFAHLNKEKNIITLCRDIIGEKPLYYSHNKKTKEFCFASEKKAISTEHTPSELNPREILTYNIQTNTITLTENKLQKPTKQYTQSYEKIKEKTAKLLEEAILKQIPKDTKKNPIGILFSGGIDSTFIAYTLKKHNIPFIAYTAKLEGYNIQEALDYIFAKEIAKRYDFPLEIATIHVDKLPPYIKKVMKLIEDNEYIKVSVAMPFYLACKKAKKENIKIMFSGLGSEEIFAGYKRHKQVDQKEVNNECYNGLLSLHQRDLYRDDVICMKNNQELRLPFLDIPLIKYALNIPIKYKLNLEENRSKIILRDIAKDIGLDEKYSERQKKAAQYGSKFDKGLLRLAKNAKMNKQEYLDSIL